MIRRREAGGFATALIHAGLFCAVAAASACAGGGSPGRTVADSPAPASPPPSTTGPAPAADAAAPAPATAAAPVRGSTIDWAADVAYLLRELEQRHPDLYFHTPRTMLHVTAEALLRRLPEMDDRGSAIALKQLLATVGDPHTDIRLDPVDRGLHQYPVRLELFDDGLFVIRTDRGHAAMLGARVVRLGALPVDAALARIRTLIPSDNGVFWKTRVGSHMLPELLHAVGVAADRDRIEMEIEASPSGRMSVHTLHAVPWSTAIQWTRPNELIAGRTPLHLGNQRRNYWARYMRPSAAIYIQLNRMVQDSLMDAARFTDGVLRMLDSERAEQVVIDLRHNGGGDSALFRPLFEGLRERMAQDADLRVHAVIGRGTFSSAVLNALELRAMGVPLVGEPTGGRPNHFGEVRSFPLPASGLMVRHSTRFFRRVPGDPPSLDPDHRIPTTFAHLRAGRDPVLDWILRH